MLINPFNPDFTWTNDLEDFKMPYKHYGQTDLEVMTRRYQNLSNRSHGYIVRYATVYG